MENQDIFAELKNEDFSDYGLVKGDGGYSIKDIQMFMLKCLNDLEDGKEKEEMIKQYEEETGQKFPKIEEDLNGKLVADFDEPIIFKNVKEEKELVKNNSQKAESEEKKNNNV
jgi:hypothetical protein